MIGAPPSPVAPPQPVSAAMTVLSNERTFTRAAGIVRTAWIRTSPSPRATRIARLRWLTEEGQLEVYLLLRRWVSSDGEAWIELRVPGRPNGRLGWTPATALGPIRLTHWALRVSRRRLRAWLSYDGRAVWSTPVGIGAPGTPTPPGHFVVRELLDVPGHTLYVPYAFGTSDYSVLTEWPAGGVVGIHGTNQPQLIPGRPSHGCIRMRNADIAFLAHHLPIGAPVDIE
jgi:hypothetical protein